MNSLQRYRIRLYGIVQGVGFRPFVSRTAAAHHLSGSVCNKGSFVEVFVQGTGTELSAFIRSLKTDAPERSAILKTDETKIPPVDGEQDFCIIESAKEKGQIFVSPDIATCDKCREELFDPQNRRYLHPFINCTACGPRLTILDSMPYDRERTSMKEFPMCPECSWEYTHAESRRYDAQPVCCNDCGPELYTLKTEQRLSGGEALRYVRSVIRKGGIAAVKGIGGFHLCCDAADSKAVARLRQLKDRPFKPFAVMAKNFTVVERECVLEPGTAEVLNGPQKPIVLLKRRPGGRLCDGIAPGNPSVGMMLPYAPVQMLLFSYPDGLGMPDCFVMTSGNRRGAPICRTDEDARAELSPLCDVILSNNRTIRTRADDSVMAFYNGSPYMIRRSRGYAPLPFIMSKKRKGNVLGIGGELKNTFCLAHEDLFYPSAYIGDLSDVRSVTALTEAVVRMEELLETKPQAVGCDLHPRYNSTAVAESLGIPVVPVQHHYAHILSCMAENDCTDTVIGVSFDGTGYGSDGTIWGGEFLRADCRGFERAGSIAPFIQAGGDLSSREGWRCAAALLLDSFDGNEDQARAAAAQLALCTDGEFSVVCSMIRNKLNTVTSTSAGRLFDAVSAVLGLKKTSTFEGEASMALQFAAEKELSDSKTDVTALFEPPVPGTELTVGSDGFFTLNTTALFNNIVQARINGADTGRLALVFHVRLAYLIAAACRRLRRTTGLTTVALSGGVFQNLLLLDRTKKQLEKDGFSVLIHSLVPPNDGGIALGQAVAVMEKLNNETE